MADYSFTIGMRTTRAIHDVEDWLDAHCRGRWQVTLGDMDETLTHKELIISFEKAEDRDVFKSSFAHSKPAPPGRR